MATIRTLQQIQQEYARLVSSYSAGRQDLRQNLFVYLIRLWKSLSDKQDGAEVADFAKRTVQLIQGMQQQEANRAWAFQRQTLKLYDVNIPQATMKLPDQPRGVPPEVVAQRPVEEYRRLIFEGFDEAIAEERAQRRMIQIADDDASLAMRLSSIAALDAAGKDVLGYRRVIHPELSTGGTCGLCVAASDRIYYRTTKLDANATPEQRQRAQRQDEAREVASDRIAETGFPLMPVHNRCHCTITAVLVGERDPGSILNRADLKALYAFAGSTSAVDLANVRYQVNEHNELGPQLRVQGQKFRDISDVMADTKTSVEDKAQQLETAAA